MVGVLFISLFVCLWYVCCCHKSKQGVRWANLVQIYGPIQHRTGSQHNPCRSLFQLAFPMTWLTYTNCQEIAIWLIVESLFIFFAANQWVQLLQHWSNTTAAATAAASRCTRCHCGTVQFKPGLVAKSKDTIKHTRHNSHRYQWLTLTMTLMGLLGDKWHWGHIHYNDKWHRWWHFMTKHDSPLTIIVSDCSFSCSFEDDAGTDQALQKVLGISNNMSYDLDCFSTDEFKEGLGKLDDTMIRYLIVTQWLFYDG